MIFSQKYLNFGRAAQFLGKYDNNGIKMHLFFNFFYAKFCELS